MESSKGLRHHPNDKPLRLRNQTCVYCSTMFGPGVKRTMEHVIAKRFVPEIDFSKQWNLIANACEACAKEKGDLESDISAVTLQPDGFGRFANADARVPREAKRKGKGAISHRTGKPVGESHEELGITASGRTCLSPGRDNAIPICQDCRGPEH